MTKALSPEEKATGRRSWQTWKESRGKCECHPNAQVHRFDEELICISKGCETTWHHHQLKPKHCEGVPGPVRGMRAHRDDA